MPEPSIYDYLAKKDVSELTISQLNSATKLTNLDPVNIEFWQGVITLNRVLSDSRTYGNGLPIPEASEIAVQPCPPSESVTFQPSGSEVWAIQGIQIVAASGTPVMEIQLYNGSELVIMHSGTSSTSAASFFPTNFNLSITNSVYLAVRNTDGSNAVNVSVAYNKVSL